ncbi:MAG TPA: hypothetical protein VM687_01770 [Stenotrophomonas sp.]|nr:hypothetical protein [Stenotrophomonas sp.]
MRLSILPFAWLLLCTIGGCAAAAPPATSPPPSASSSSLAGAQLDLRCRSDADCTVKNVGNCCGAAPACVNVASPTDPAAVMAQCHASGRMSVCGSAQITGCQCVAGQCSAKPATADTLRRPIDTPEPVR